MAQHSPSITFFKASTQNHPHFPHLLLLLSTIVLVSIFEEGFQNAWRERNSLVVASEMMDIVASEKIFCRIWTMKLVLHSMPWNSIDDDSSSDRLEGSNTDITVVVNFCTPRVEHLISM